MSSLNGYLNVRSPTMRIIARLLLDGTPMSTWDIVAASGLCYTTVRAKLKILKDSNAIHVDRWFTADRYGAKPVPIYVAGNYPDAPKHVKRPRNAPRLRRQKEKYYMDKHESRVSTETDWNSIMHGLVKGK